MRKFTKLGLFFAVLIGFFLIYQTYSNRKPSVYSTIKTDPTASTTDSNTDPTNDPSLTNLQFKITIEENKELLLNTKRTRNQSSNRDGISPFLSFSEPTALLVAGQQLDLPLSHCSAVECIGNYPTVYTLDSDPMNPRWNEKINNSRISEDYLARGNMDFISFAASPDLKYQMFTTAQDAGVVAVVSPEIADFDLGGPEDVAYGFAQLGGDTYAALYSGLYYLTRIIPIPNKYLAANGATANRCSEATPDTGGGAGATRPNPDYNRCMRRLYNLGQRPSTAPQILVGPKAVVGSNVLLLEGVNSGSCQTGNCPHAMLTVYSLQQPTPLQSAVLPDVLKFSELQKRGSRLTLYTKKILNKNYVVIEEIGAAPHAFQVFELTGSGNSARLEARTPLAFIRFMSMASTLIVVGGEMVYFTFEMNMSGNIVKSYTPHAFLFSEFNRLASTLDESLENPIQVNNLSVDRIKSLASFNQGASSYLYLGYGGKHYVWKLSRKL